MNYNGTKVSFRSVSLSASRSGGGRAFIAGLGKKAWRRANRYMRCPLLPRRTQPHSPRSIEERRHDQRETPACVDNLAHMPLSRTALAQHMGTRGFDSVGKEGPADAFDDEPPSGWCIMVEGQSEIRLQPTDLRIVFAVTAEGKTAQECNQSVSHTIECLTEAWAKIGIPPDRIVTDFIAVIPCYTWELKGDTDPPSGVEKKTGYRMQTNVHLAVPKVEESFAALGAAFEQGVSDVLAFDYSSREMGAAKERVQEQALKAAQQRAERLVYAQFPERPPLVNVQAKTKVFFPESLYRTVEASHDDRVEAPWRREVHLIHAYRPKTAYYHGSLLNADIGPTDLTLRPEVSVVSTVRLSFESPEAKLAFERKRELMRLSSRKTGRARERDAEAADSELPEQRGKGGGFFNVAPE